MLTLTMTWDTVACITLFIGGVFIVMYHSTYVRPLLLHQQKQQALKDARGGESPSQRSETETPPQKHKDHPASTTEDDHCRDKTDSGKPALDDPSKQLLQARCEALQDELQKTETERQRLEMEVNRLRNLLHQHPPHHHQQLKLGTGGDSLNPTPRGGGSRRSLTASFSAVSPGNLPLSSAVSAGGSNENSFPQHHSVSENASFTSIVSAGGPSDPPPRIDNDDGSEEEKSFVLHFPRLSDDTWRRVTSAFESLVRKSQPHPTTPRTDSMSSVSVGDKEQPTSTTGFGGDQKRDPWWDLHDALQDHLAVVEEEHQNELFDISEAIQRLPLMIPLSERKQEMDQDRPVATLKHSSPPLQSPYKARKEIEKLLLDHHRRIDFIHHEVSSCSEFRAPEREVRPRNNIQSSSYAPPPGDHHHDTAPLMIIPLGNSEEGDAAPSMVAVGKGSDDEKQPKIEKQECQSKVKAPAAEYDDDEQQLPNIAERRRGREERSRPWQTPGTSTSQLHSSRNSSKTKRNKKAKREESSDRDKQKERETGAIVRLTWSRTPEASPNESVVTPPNRSLGALPPLSPSPAKLQQQQTMTSQQDRVMSSDERREVDIQGDDPKEKMIDDEALITGNNSFNSSSSTKKRCQEQQREESTAAPSQRRLGFLGRGSTGGQNQPSNSSSRSVMGDGRSGFLLSQLTDADHATTAEKTKSRQKGFLLEAPTTHGGTKPLPPRGQGKSFSKADVGKRVWF